MRSEPETLLTISEFAKIMGQHQWYLAQFGYQSTTPLPSRPFPSRKVIKTECQNPVFEYEWQDEKFNRYEVARAINEAENIFALESKYWPAPKYILDEEHDYPLSYNRALPTQGLYQSNGDTLKQINLDYGYLHQVGIKTLTLIDDTVAVTTNIPAGPVYTFSATTPVPAGTLPSEIVVFFTATDRLGQPKEEWQIRPINVSIVANVATITGDAFLLAAPEQYLAYAPIPLVVEEPTHFVAEIEVWRETVDATQGGEFYWANGCSLDVEIGCFPKIKTRTSVVMPQRARLEDGSLVSLQSGCQATCGSESPKHLSINYLAGYPRRADGRMDFIHAQRIAWMAAGYLKCKPCGCSCGKTGEKDNTLDWWTEIPKVGEKLDRIVVTFDDLSNPFGPQRGCIKAWRSVRDIRIVKGKAI